MRRVSKKRAKIERKLEPFLDAYRAEFPACQICYMVPATDIHELCRGKDRLKARHERALIMHVCRECHDYIQNESFGRQLAAKLLSNSGYDLAKFLEVKGWQPGFIEQGEVEAVARRMRFE